MAAHRPPISLDASSPEALRLLAEGTGRPGEGFESPKHSSSPVVAFEPFHLEVLGDSPVEVVAAGSLFLGAVHGSHQHIRDAWFYRPDWVFFSGKAARETMAQVYGRGRQVRVFQLPVLAVFAGASVLLATELWSRAPFREAALRFDVLREFYPEKASERMRDGRLHPASLADAVRFLGDARQFLRGPLIGLVLREALDEAGGLGAPAPAYLVFTLRHARVAPSLTASLAHDWEARALDLSDVHVRRLAGGD